MPPTLLPSCCIKGLSRVASIHSPDRLQLIEDRRCITVQHLVAPSSMSSQTRRPIRRQGSVSLDGQATHPMTAADRVLATARVAVVENNTCLELLERRTTTQTCSVSSRHASPARAIHALLSVYTYFRPPWWFSIGIPQAAVPDKQPRHQTEAQSSPRFACRNCCPSKPQSSAAMELATELWLKTE